MLQLAFVKGSAGLAVGGQKSEALTLSAVSKNKLKTENLAYWTKPFACGQRSYLKIDNEFIGARCGSRSCISCQRSKLKEFTNIAHHLKKNKDEVYRSLICTPTDDRTIRTDNDLKVFFKQFRKMLRSWVRSSGLGFAFWVAEGVIKDNEISSITCPIGSLKPCNNYLSDCSLNLHKKITDLHENCKLGNCKFCKGGIANGNIGKLPACHVHIHLIVAAKPFCYCANICECTTNYPHPFTDKKGQPTGLKGHAEKYNIFVRSEKVRSKNGKESNQIEDLQHYLSKGCIQYIEKGQHTKTVDWDNSAKNQAIVSWILGNNKTRGTVGRAYGLKTKTKSIDKKITMGGTGASLDWMSNQQFEHTPSHLFDFVSNKKGSNSSQDELSKKISPELMPKNEANKKNASVLVSTLSISKSSKLNDCFNVLQKTQLDTATEFEKDLLIWSCVGWTKPNLTIKENPMLCRHWNNKTVLYDSDLWTKPYQKGRIFGRGSSMVFIEKDNFDGATASMILDTIGSKILPFYQWRVFIENISHRKNRKKGSYERSKNREMA